MTRTLTRTCHLCGDTESPVADSPRIARYTVCLVCTDEHSRDDGEHAHDEGFTLCPPCSVHLADRLAQWAYEQRKEK